MVIQISIVREKILSAMKLANNINFEYLKKVRISYMRVFTIQDYYCYYVYLCRFCCCCQSSSLKSDNFNFMVIQISIVRE
jgi:hypothetical protein